jgi:glycine/D-amino acid oxidase-like deaminating enzyme
VAVLDSAPQTSGTVRRLPACAAASTAAGLATSFGGHGFKLAPAIGALIARRIAGPATEFDTGVAPAFLAFDRAPIAIKSRSVLAFDG